MQSLSMVLLAGGAASFLSSVALVATKSSHGHFSLDSTIGIQKVHGTPTPRIGGVAIALGLIACVALNAPASPLLLLMLLASIPAFAMGLWEDVTKRVPVYARLLATMVSGILGWWLTDTSLTRVNVPGLDWLLMFGPLSVLFTAFAVSGAANAVNIIDGFNGLASGSVLVALAALGMIAAQAGDTELVHLCLLVGAVAAGFLMVNFPFGKIFLGDGGAYLLGFLMGWIAVMLPMRNPSVSVWATLLACAYPIVETGFSIVRRRRHHRSPGAADRLHLHSLVNRRVIRRWLPGASVLRINSTTGAVMWVGALLPAVPAMVWPEQSLVLALWFAACAFGYSVVYARLTQLHWCSLAEMMQFPAVAVKQN
ncbi:MAG: glycosyltransferase family 4 protein [Ramlibacter sp.]|nr:glycosyltransferase family 4 protein [Ramlibacter sp.]